MQHFTCATRIESAFVSIVDTQTTLAGYEEVWQEKTMGQSSVCFWVIDDDLQFGKSLRRMLNCRGFRAEYFGSAQSFLDSVPPGQPGYAIVDIRMPGYDGFQLIRKMQDLHYGMPVILMTGHLESDARDRAVQSGAIGFLQKPFSGDSLLELIYKQEMEESDREP